MNTEGEKMMREYVGSHYGRELGKLRPDEYVAEVLEDTGGFTIGVDLASGESFSVDQPTIVPKE